jgi:hypothetical protein
MGINDELLRRAHQYVQKTERALGEQLGVGNDGIVITVKSQPENGTSALLSAIKVHRRQKGYARERDVYLRLRDVELRTIKTCAVPVLLSYDDDLWIVEMTLVARPFVLDFAGAELDEPPDFSEEVLADWRAEKDRTRAPTGARHHIHFSCGPSCSRPPPALSIKGARIRECVIPRVAFRRPCPRA